MSIPHSTDYLEEDYINDEYDGQGFYNSAPYMDPSTPMYYNYGMYYGHCTPYVMYKISDGFF